ncbi:hypothetical protein, partial [uncultured Parasutterella sp.]|uniref:hypothetical protein n=1 Tax=uncultured Parasutterella sp. TaxID=1263098 RepID=UPI00272D8659
TRPFHGRYRGSNPREDATIYFQSRRLGGFAVSAVCFFFVPLSGAESFFFSPGFSLVRDQGHAQKFPTSYFSRVRQFLTI